VGEVLAAEGRLEVLEAGIRRVVMAGLLKGEMKPLVALVVVMEVAVLLVVVTEVVLQVVVLELVLVVVMEAVLVAMEVALVVGAMEVVLRLVAMELVRVVGMEVARVVVMEVLAMGMEVLGMGTALEAIEIKLQEVGKEAAHRATHRIEKLLQFPGIYEKKILRFFVFFVVM